ncbi:MAG: tRNA preQ1(34) S-adenosylmethionine ribosyltransferase-isomerase QueA [Pseudomonadota bacterium]
MKLSDFDFALPQERIATRPARPRSSARLLAAGPDWLDDARAIDLPRWLNPGDRLVLNDTRVLPARMAGLRRRAGEDGSVAQSKIEVTLLSRHADGTWSALLKPLRKVKDGESIALTPDLSAVLERRAGGQGYLRFDQDDEAVLAVFERDGAMPLPPYIAAQRAADAADREDYQTVWAAKTGAVAAPTASLHFDHALLVALEARGVALTFVTLHVGAGTFLPVTVDDIADHVMHAEWGEVTAAAAAEINATRRAGGRVIPVGTTALRLIESAARGGGGVQAWRGETDIFITPGFTFQVTDALMTNFHLPKSTLMMLVSALMGRERIMAIYDHAIAAQYRFFSYGDASLLLPR